MGRVLVLFDGTTLSLILARVTMTQRTMDSLFSFRRKGMMLRFLLEEVNPFAVPTSFSFDSFSFFH